MTHEQNDLEQFDFESLIEDSVNHILEHNDSQAYFRWLQQSLIRYQHDLDTELTHDRRMQIMLSSTIGHMIWNATPLPDNDFQPQPLEKPQRNSICICGSGKKYKHCCSGMPQMPPLSDIEIWPIVLTQLKPDSYKQALSSGHVPIESLFIAAEEFAMDGKYRKALDLLEPRLDNISKNNSIEYEYALNQICILYDELGYSLKKQKLLDHVLATAGRSPLRSGAYQRLATIAMDNQDPTLAWQYFNQALQDDPQAISLSILEVQLLLAENKTEQAKQRAQFWLKKLRKLNIPEDEYIMEFLTQAAKDPSKAFLDIHRDMIDSTDGDLDTLLTTISDRPCPDYSIVGINDHRERQSDEAESGLAEMLETLLEDEFPNFDSQTSLEDSVENSIELIAPAEIQKIEQLWNETFDFEKPFGTHETSMIQQDPWIFADDWVEFLEAHPIAFDSLDILDDIATALASHEMTDHPWHDERLLKPVLTRAALIISKNLDSIKAPHLSWLLQENRPALRSVARLIAFYFRNNNSDEAFLLMQKIVQLNPNDNHGFRTILANEYLIRGENERCLQLVSQYNGDMNPEIVFGEVLALYRQERMDDALNVLCKAIKTFPKIVPGLLAKKIKKPKIDNMMVTIGGEDQVWIYRHEMREQWLTTEGVMQWLTVASAQCE